MNARVILFTAGASATLLWAISAAPGAPEAVDVGVGFGETSPRGRAEEPSVVGESLAPDPSPIVTAEPLAESLGEADHLAPPAVEIAPFKALYDVKARGVLVGELEVSLEPGENDEWIYRQKASTKGVASLFGPEDLVETSRFRRDADGLQMIEYRSKRKGGDADDNARFVFDHAAARVDRDGKGAPWSVDAPKGTVDPLLMTLAMRFELAEGKVAETLAEGNGPTPSYIFNVPRQGRIKVYEFGVVGLSELEVTGRRLSTVQVDRLRDKKDQTSIWTAPEMDYLPVRILKTRKEGGSSEVLLRSFVRE